MHIHTTCTYATHIQSTYNLHSIHMHTYNTHIVYIWHIHIHQYTPQKVNPHCTPQITTHSLPLLLELPFRADNSLELNKSYTPHATHYGCCCVRVCVTYESCQDFFRFSRNCHFWRDRNTEQTSGNLALLTKFRFGIFRPQCDHRADTQSPSRHPATGWTTSSQSPLPCLRSPLPYFLGTDPKSTPSFTNTTRLVIDVCAHDIYVNTVVHRHLWV